MPRYDRTARLLRVAQLLHDHPNGLTAKEIAQRCGVTTRTAFRDLHALDEHAGVTTWQSDGRWGATEDSFLPPLRLSLTQAVALFLASRLAHRTTMERNPALEAAWSTLATALPEPVARHVQATVTAMAARPPAGRSRRVLEALALGWAEQRRVEIAYPTPGDGPARTRRIEPYALEPVGSRGGLYVIARDVGVDGLRTFKVERIEDATLIDETFSLPDHFSIDAYLAGSWAIWGEEAPVEVSVRFSPAVATLVAETCWHPSQQVVRHADGSLTWSACLAGTIEITPWIRSWGPDAEALAPPELRARLARESREIAAIYTDCRRAG